jgi:5-hydroxyisourate hydrolase-like protein (transthyretin family)
MKKTLLQLLLLLLPFAASAQTEPALYEDFKEDVRDLSRSFPWDDHINIMQVNLDNDVFELIAITDKMNVLWKTQLKGYALSCGKFKGKILAVAATGYSKAKGPDGIYKGYLINAQTGKPELEKILYEGTGEYWAGINHFYTTDGSMFKMVVRQSAMKRAAFSLIYKPNDYYKTKELTIVDFNERLEPASSFKPDITGGTVIGTTGNYEGDIFVSVFKGLRTVEITKYQADKNLLAGKLSQDIDLRTNEETKDPSEHIKTYASESDRNVVYFSVMHKNYEKDIQLAVGKLDFNKKTKLLVAEIFDKEHKKELEKSFVKLSKDIDKPTIGYAGFMEVRYMNEENGTLLIAMSNRHIENGQYAAWNVEQAIVINGYDMALKLKFQQLMPSYYGYLRLWLPTGFHFINDKLYVIANTKDGMTTIKSIYGELDTKTGQWSKMYQLSKKKLKNASFGDGENVLWFKNNYILPYLAPHGLMGIKYDITLQQNGY